MRDDPYRRPSPRPVEKPRGVVVRRADEPEDLEAAEERRRQAKIREHGLLVQSEREEAQRTLDRRARTVGLVMLAIGVVLGAVAILALRAGERYPHTSDLAPAMLLTGGWLLTVGAGRASALESIPSWVTYGATGAFALGFSVGTSSFEGLLSIFAR